MIKSSKSNLQSTKFLITFVSIDKQYLILDLKIFVVAYLIWCWQLRSDLSNLHFNMLIDTNTCYGYDITSVTKNVFCFSLKLPRYYRVYFSLSAHLKKSSSSGTEGNCNKTLTFTGLFNLSQTVLYKEKQLIFCRFWLNFSIWLSIIFYCCPVTPCKK